MKSIKKSAVYLIITLFFISCNTDQSIQKYYVNNSENPNFISLTIPANVLSVSDVELTTDQKEAYESIEKLNVLAFKMKEDNRSLFKEEKEKISTILSHKKYQELMRVNSGKQRGVVKYVGDENSIDEVIVFGNDNEKGFALVRVLGDDMKPENMMQLVQAIEKGGINGGGLDQLRQFFEK